MMRQMGGLGPILGQAQHFHRYAAEKVPYAIEWYTREGRRLLCVMERQFDGRDHLAGDYRIADIACFPWVRIHKMANQCLDDLPRVSRRYAAIDPAAACDPAPPRGGHGSAKFADCRNLVAARLLRGDVTSIRKMPREPCRSTA
jgi:glutathione S-transferase